LARAKRTNRTDARRRHRAEQAATGVDPVVETADTGAPARRRGTAPSGTAPIPTGPQRRGSISGAFKGAFRPLDLRGDLRALPKLLVHWSVLATIGITIVGTAVFILATNDLGRSLDFSLSDPFAGQSAGQATSLSYLVISLFVTPPPAAGAFIIGFFAKRASWLTGLVFGLVAAICYSVLVMTPAGRLIIGQNAPEYYVIQAWLIGPIGAALFASAAAWYRRFLDLVNPNRGQRQGRGSQPKPQSGRGNAPRNRLSGSSR
jgi:hypothetical protein